MDYNTMVTHLTNPVTVGLFILLVVSEVLGSNEKIKSSSIYGLIKVVLVALKDNVFPQPTKVEPPKPEQP